MDTLPLLLLGILIGIIWLIMKKFKVLDQAQFKLDNALNNKEVIVVASSVDKTFLFIKMLNMIAPIFLIMLTIYLITANNNLAANAKEIGSIALYQNVTKNNESAVQLFSISPIISSAMLLLSLILLRY